MFSTCEAEVAIQSAAAPLLRNQRTLAKSTELCGVGLFSGLKINMRFVPAPVGHGIVFKRVDLKNEPTFRAHVDNVCGTPRCTNLGDGKVIIQSVEHVLSALRAFNIDNLTIEVDGPEIPAGDGSSSVFVSLIEKSRMVVQDQPIEIKRVRRPVHWSKNDIHLIALPSDQLRISYTLSYPGHPLLDSQFFSTTLTPEVYCDEIAESRTFSLYEEIVPLLDQGMIKGGSLDSGVIIKGEEIMNPGGARFPNEMVRHKVLDLIGDLSLVGTPFTAHIIAIRSGHYSNTVFAKKIIESLGEE